MACSHPIVRPRGRMPCTPSDVTSVPANRPSGALAEDSGSSIYLATLMSVPPTVLSLAYLPCPMFLCIEGGFLPDGFIAFLRLFQHTLAL